MDQGRRDQGTRENLRDRELGTGNRELKNGPLFTQMRVAEKEVQDKILRRVATSWREVPLSWLRKQRQLMNS